MTIRDSKPSPRLGANVSSQTLSQFGEVARAIGAVDDTDTMSTVVAMAHRVVVAEQYGATVEIAKAGGPMSVATATSMVSVQSRSDTPHRLGANVSEQVYGMFGEIELALSRECDVMATAVALAHSVVQAQSRGLEVHIIGALTGERTVIGCAVYPSRSVAISA